MYVTVFSVGFSTDTAVPSLAPKRIPVHDALLDSGQRAALLGRDRHRAGLAARADQARAAHAQPARDLLGLGDRLLAQDRHAVVGRDELAGEVPRDDRPAAAPPTLGSGWPVSRSTPG